MYKPSWGIAAGVAGGLFLAYCVYFDRKRRSDPDFKKKLRERRQAEKNRQAAMRTSDLPDMNNYEAVQKFFIQEVQVGEELLALGDIENGVEHLANAVSVCGQPNQLLGVLQQTLPPQIFQLLLQRLPIVTSKFAPPKESLSAQRQEKPALSAELADDPLDDLE